MKRWGIWTAVVLLLGVLLGRLGSGTTPVERIEVERPTKTVTQEVPKPYMPEACRRAVDMSVTVRDAAGTFDTVTGPQLDIMEATNKAISARNFREINEQITKQHKIRNETVGAATSLHSELSVFSQILTECNKELGHG